MRAATKYLILLVLLTSSTSIYQYTLAQTVEQIKANREVYLYGEGSATTLQKADAYALQLLIGQISTSIESKFTMRSEWGNQTEMKEKVDLILNTYSAATLHNTERIVISNEPDAVVFRYIKRSDLYKVFAQRKNKISEFISAALEAEEKLQIADALRYYYWALVLAKSHPDYNELYYTLDNGEEKFIETWLPARMNNIFSSIHISVENIDDEEEVKTILVDVQYNNQPVVNFDYSYWDGRDWTNLISARNGKGFLEYYGPSAKDLKEGKLKAEYIFQGEARIDKELETVLANIDPVPFRRSYYNLAFDNSEKDQAVKPEEPALPDLSMVEDPETYQELIEKVVKAINSKDYQSVKSMFTPMGYDMFDKLIHYGNAKVLEEPHLQAMAFNGGIMCRSVLMSFNFRNNTKQFVEEVIFHFNQEKLIESLAFGLSELAVNDILSKTVWAERDRFVLINFLEHYKTAYALKRLDYIESIFADDALIITGYKVKVKSTPENRYLNNEIIKYNRYSKEEYLKKLKYSFNSKEYINIKFEDSEIRKAGTGGDIYGVQIRQNYHSSNYGDVGYLFLLVDLNEPEEPVIHVRTWQPEKNADGSIYGLADF